MLIKRNGTYIHRHTPTPTYRYRHANTVKDEAAHKKQGMKGEESRYKREDGGKEERNNVCLAEREVERLCKNMLAGAV